MGQAGLSVRSYQTLHVVVLELHGRLTAATVPNLEPHLAELQAQLDRPLVVDLAGLDECDSAGASMLAATAQVAATVAGGHSGGLRLAAPNPHTCTVLHGTGVLHTVATYTTVDRAALGDPHDRLSTPPRSG